MQVEKSDLKVGLGTCHGRRLAEEIARRTDSGIALHRSDTAAVVERYHETSRTMCLELPLGLG